MSEVVGEAILKIRTDDSGVEKDTAAAGRKAGEAYSRGASGPIKKLAGIAATAFAGAQVVDFARGAIEGASDLNETISKTQVVFGSAAQSVLDFSTTSAAKLGQTRQEALDAASTFGIFGKAAGLQGTQLGAFSTKFTKLATDLASFNNTSPQEAIDAIGAALRGEAEPIRRYGVLLDDASLRQEALRKGLIKTTKQALTPQQRTLAASSLILKQTKLAQGDFARTSDGLANQQRILTASFKDARTELGQQLLPVVLKVVRAANEEAIPAIKDFIKGMEDGTGPGGQFRDVLEDVGGVLHDVYDVGVTVIKFVDGLPGPVKKFGAEAIVASIAVSKLSSAIGGMRLTGFISQLTNATTRTAALKTGMANAAGAGGALLLADGISKADTKLGALETTLGAAAVGFAVGGPIGLGLATAIAGFLSFKEAILDTGDAKMPTPKQLGLTDIIGALDEANGLVQSEKGIVDFLNGKTKGAPPPGSSIGTTIRDTARAYGIPDRTITKALAGDTKAFIAVKKTFADAVRKDPSMADWIRDDADTVITSVESFRKAQQKQRFEILKTQQQTKDYGKTLDALPKDKATTVRAIGILPTRQGIIDLASKIKATPDEIDVLVEASGVKLTKSELAEVKDRVHQLNGQSATVYIDANTQKALAKFQDLRDKLVDGFGLFSGRANGGPVQAGVPYVVGERRPEVFVPETNGRIVPSVSQFAGQPTSTANARDIGNAVALALIASGAAGPTIVNPIPETATTTRNRQVANAAFLLGG